MATSRYEYSKIIKFTEGEFNISKLSTWGNISSEEISSDSDILYEYKYTDRLENLAYKYLGDSRYWWMICVANNISSPFDKKLTPGALIVIPGSVELILNVLRAKIDRKN